MKNIFKKIWFGIKYTFGMILGICGLPFICPVIFWNYFKSVHKKLVK